MIYNHQSYLNHQVLFN